MTITDPAIGRRRRRHVAWLLVVPLVLPLGACGDRHRITSEEAWLETSAAKGHPIAFVERNEYLDVELPPRRQALSQNQYIDVYRFAVRYLEEATGSISVVHPGSQRGGPAIDDVRRALHDAGVAPARIVRGDHAKSGLVTLAYQRPLAVAPECGNWPRDVGHEPERIAHPNFGCATQRNLAGMVANSRDLMGSQSESPASGERRNRIWSKYTAGDAGGGQSAAAGAEAGSDAKPKGVKK